MAVQKCTPTPILAARAALRYYHVTFYPEPTPPTDSPRVHALVLGIRRKFANPITKMKILSPELAKTMALNLIEEGLPTKLRLAALFNLMYFTCTRFEEVQNLLTDHVSISPHGNLKIKG